MLVFINICIWLATHVFFQIIRWPNQARQNEIANAFQLSCGIPGVVGIIDGTHIRLSAPIKGDQDYINRKGFPSVVLQVCLKDIYNFLCSFKLYLLCQNTVQRYQSKIFFVKSINYLSFEMTVFSVLKISLQYSR